jgi:ATP-dependent Clp protease ATP-binding subunit ClpA
LLFGRLSNGGRVTVDLDKEGKIKLDFEEEKTAAVV